MDSAEGLVKEIAKKAGKPEGEVRKLIEEKQTELSGLVSTEGAAYIVGRELGVSLLKESSRQLKARNIIPGMRSVDFLGRITRTSTKLLNPLPGGHIRWILFGLSRPVSLFRNGVTALRRRLTTMTAYSLLTSRSSLTAGGWARTCGSG